MVIVSATNSHSSISIDRSGHVEHSGIVVVFPSITSPEDILISDFEDH